MSIRAVSCIKLNIIGEFWWIPSPSKRNTYYTWVTHRFAQPAISLPSDIHNAIYSSVRNGILSSSSFSLDICIIISSTSFLFTCKATILHSGALRLDFSTDCRLFSVQKILFTFQSSTSIFYINLEIVSKFYKRYSYFT